MEPARGSGHALGAARRDDKAHLRTRVGPQGMDYKGYNIAVHEMGHNVEQVFSMTTIDHTLLQGVPNTAFTEALAFVFQAPRPGAPGPGRARSRGRAPARPRRVLGHAGDRGRGAGGHRGLAMARGPSRRPRRRSSARPWWGSRGTSGTATSRRSSACKDVAAARASTRTWWTRGSTRRTTRWGT